MCGKSVLVSRIEKSIKINQTLETVWNLITDFDKTAEIANGIERFELTSDRPFRMGSTVRQVGLVSGYTYEFDLKVTEFIENKRIVFENTSTRVSGRKLGIKMNVSWLLKPLDIGTQFFFIICVEFPIFLRVFSGTAVTLMEKQVQSWLKSYKKELEK
jgi:carbon monoxide dehydrogenase subunit G